MVRIEETGFLSDIRKQTKYREFPGTELQSLYRALESIPEDIFTANEKGTELKRFDAEIADSLTGYEHEHDNKNGRNPVCKLWGNQGFDHSVDLYHPEKRIAIEIEKSEIKRVSDDILKFIKGGKTQKSERKKIEFGCLIVPTNYRGSSDLFRGSMRTLEFIRSVLFVEDIAVLGYSDPRWD